MTTSLKIPAMERVTTEVRWRRANSDAVMQNAIAPGNNNRAGPRIGPLSSTRIFSPPKRAGKPSTGIARMNKLVNMIGAR